MGTNGRRPFRDFMRTAYVQNETKGLSLTTFISCWVATPCIQQEQIVPHYSFN